MKYYVVADPHGFYTYLREALESEGYFQDNGAKKLVVLGDVLDRGSEALEMVAFLLEEIEKGNCILVRGNHEDLLLNLLNNWHTKSYEKEHHIYNGTVDTVLQLTHHTWEDLGTQPDMVCRDLMKTPFVQEVIPQMVDYFETPQFVFVHGWVPCMVDTLLTGYERYTPLDDWRHADAEFWRGARRINGMAAVKQGGEIPGKTVVCGHFHTAWGHEVYYGKKEVYLPLRDDGILALDACTVCSRRVNCVVLEDA